MSHSETDILKRALAREKLAKQQAEKIVEDRILQLYTDNLDLSNEIKAQEFSSKELLEQLIDGVLVLTADGQITTINKAIYDLVEISDGTVFSHINDFKPENTKKISHFLEHILKAQKSTTEILFPFSTRTGKDKIARIRASVLKDNSGQFNGIQAICTDVTEQEKIKKIAQEQERIAAIEKEIFQDILVEDNIFDIGWALVKSIGRYLNSDDVVFYANIDNQLVQIASAAHKSTQDRIVNNPVVLELGQGVVGRVAVSKKARVIEDSSLVAEYIVDQERRFSEITIPIVLDDTVVGIIDSESPKKSHYSLEQADFLTKIANYVGLRIRNAAVEYENSLKDQRLNLSYARLQSIIENFNQAVVYEGIDGKIRYLNQKFLDLFGMKMKLEDVIGMKCDIARVMLADKFENSQGFSSGVTALLREKKAVDREVLKGVDGRIFERSYRPLLHNEVIDGHLWSYVDKTIEHRFNANISFERAKYAQIIANMDLGLLEVDNEDHIILANDAFCEMTGYSSEELVGQVAAKILVNEKEAERIKKYNATRISGITSVYEIEYITKKGEVKYMLISGGPNTDLAGKTIGSIGCHLDITKIKELEQSRLELIGNLSASNQELRNYAHVVSHDLKTPLRSISAGLNWLKEDNEAHFDDASLSYLEIIEDALAKMDKLISETLLFSEIKHDKTKMRAVNAGDIVLQIIADLAPIYPNIKFHSGKLPTISFNESKIIQVFQNIIENACKYSDLGKDSFIKIHCVDEKDHFLFSVEDNGIGIAVKHAHHVFEIFQKLNNNPDSNGIGLSIVKKIIESNKGSIWFESEEGLGTTFKFTIAK